MLFSDRSRSGRWRMTEFDIGAYNSVGGRQIDILDESSIKHHQNNEDGDYPGCLGTLFLTVTMTHSL